MLTGRPGGAGSTAGRRLPAQGEGACRTADTQRHKKQQGPHPAAGLDGGAHPVEGVDENAGRLDKRGHKDRGSGHFTLRAAQSLPEPAGIGRRNRQATCRHSVDSGVYPYLVATCSRNFAAGIRRVYLLGCPLAGASMVDSTDLAQVLHEAKDIAQSVAQKLSSAHRAAGALHRGEPGPGPPEGEGRRRGPAAGAHDGGSGRGGAAGARLVPARPRHRPAVRLARGGLPAPAHRLRPGALRGATTC